LNHAGAACFISCAPASSSASPLERKTTVSCEDWGTKVVTSAVEHKSFSILWSLTREAASQKSEKHVVTDAVKGVLVRSATRRTKELSGVADTGSVHVLKVLPEQRNHMGWRTL
jgi:hypothetical protein